MRSLRNSLGFGLLMSIVVFSAVSLAAVEPKREGARWENLQTLAPGDTVRVVLNNKESQDGTFQSVGEQALTVRIGNGLQTFTREDVLRVSTKRRSHRGRNALLGMAAGVGAGIAVAASATSKDPEQAPAYIFSPVAMGAAGAGLGAAFSGSGWHDVYRAQ